MMGAPGEQGVASGIRFGRTAGNVDANNIAIGNVGDAYMRDINNVKPNPLLSLAGDAGHGYRRRHDVRPGGRLRGDGAGGGRSSL
jgi:hypothetical protein